MGGSNGSPTAATEREAALRAEIERLRGALAFYAKENNWRSSSVYMCGHSGDSNATMDRGRKARAALGSGDNG